MFWKIISHKKRMFNSTPSHPIMNQPTTPKDSEGPSLQLLLSLENVRTVRTRRIPKDPITITLSQEGFPIVTNTKTNKTYMFSDPEKVMKFLDDHDIRYRKQGDDYSPPTDTTISCYIPIESRYARCETILSFKEPTSIKRVLKALKYKLITIMPSSL